MRISLLMLSLVLVVGGIIGCGQQDSTDRPAWAEQYFPDYETVKSAYREIAFLVKDARKRSQHPPTTFKELRDKIVERFPETSITIRGDSPFPDILPKDHTYGWLASWGLATNSEGFPLVWTTVELREPTILYVTTAGEIHAEKREPFAKLIESCLSLGAQIASMEGGAPTNNDAYNNRAGVRTK